jgi:hypothetical protein
MAAPPTLRPVHRSIFYIALQQEIHPNDTNHGGYAAGFKDGDDVRAVS